jgi:hypothetical protein
MPRRREALNPGKFTAFCFVMLRESESREDVLDDGELFDLALELAEENEALAEAYCLRFRGFIDMSFHYRSKEVRLERPGSPGRF